MHHVARGVPLGHARAERLGRHHGARSSARSRRCSATRASSSRRGTGSASSSASRREAAGRAAGVTYAEALPPDRCRLTGSGRRRRSAGAGAGAPATPTARAASSIATTPAPTAAMHGADERAAEQLRVARRRVRLEAGHGLEQLLGDRRRARARRVHEPVTDRRRRARRQITIAANISTSARGGAGWDAIVGWRRPASGASWHAAASRIDRRRRIDARLCAMSVHEWTVAGGLLETDRRRAARAQPAPRRLRGLEHAGRRDRRRRRRPARRPHARGRGGDRAASCASGAARSTRCGRTRPTWAGACAARCISRSRSTASCTSTTPTASSSRRAFVPPHECDDAPRVVRAVGARAAGARGCASGGSRASGRGFDYEVNGTTRDSHARGAQVDLNDADVADADDPARRPRRVLRVGRAARRSDAARPAGHRRRARQPRRRERRELRGAPVRRALRDADGAGPGSACPTGVFLSPRFERYVEKSREVMGDPRVGDAARRAALDRRGVPRRRAARAACSGTGSEIAALVRDARSQRGGSRRVGRRRDHQVPGQARERPREAQRPARRAEPGTERDFLAPLPVTRLWGVGPATLQRLERMAVRTIGESRALPESSLAGALGTRSVAHLHALARQRRSARGRPRARERSRSAPRRRSRVDLRTRLARASASSSGSPTG